MNDSITHVGMDTHKKEHKIAVHYPRQAEIVGFLRCFHGIDTLTAISVLAEIFEFGRFESPEYLMSYLGLTPSEDSSGGKERKEPITKAGNRRVRRLLTESSWHYPTKRVAFGGCRPHPYNWQ